MKKILLINHSDTRGGAAVVTFRLMKALCACGIDARMLVMHKYSDSLRVAEAEPRWLAKGAFLAEHAEIFARDGFSRDNLFRISTARFGIPLHRHPWVREADAIALNWVNQGLLTLDEICRIHRMGKRIAWTMHDMWEMTGICHHAGTCTRFTSTCGNCPLICGGRHARDLSTSVQSRKARLYADVPIRFVAVSSWLADRARVSSLLGSALSSSSLLKPSLTVIPNAFPVEDFHWQPSASRESLGLPVDVRLIVMGAARLDDPIKDLPLAVRALNAVHERRPADTAAVFFGDIRDPHALDSLRMPFVHLGSIADQRRIAQIFAHATAVLSTSQYETLPGTVIEGIAAGATAVATDSGGQRDIIDHGVNGYLVAEHTPDAVADALLRALSAPFPRQAQHASMAGRFAADVIAARYKHLLLDPPTQKSL